MIIRGRVAIILSILVLICFLCIPSAYNSEANHRIMPSALHSAENGSSTTMTSGASSGIAVVGEPSHIGDLLTGTVIVTNSGNETGKVSLRIYCGAENIVFVGPDVTIAPGSSKEVSSTFTSEVNGTIDCTWSVDSIDSHIHEELQGSFSFESLLPQEIDIYSIEHEWQENSLSTRASVYLSPGRSRSVIFHVVANSTNSDSILQEIPIKLDPGVRMVQIEMGEVNFPLITFEIMPINWKMSEASKNLTSFTISKSIIQSSDLSIEASIATIPNSPDSQQISYQVSNAGEIATLPGNIRLISMSDMQVIQEIPVPAISPGGELNGFFTNQPEKTPLQGEIKVIWSTGEASSSSTIIFEFEESNDEFSLPFNPLAASYGILAGITIILVGRLVWRSVSTRTPKTSESTFRVTRKEREVKEGQEKKLVICPHCEQQLHVPLIHSGNARCPTCSLEFEVKGEADKTDKDKISSVDENFNSDNAELAIVRSSDDLLNCPDCDQALRVPIEKRPVRSRCPICKLEFIAEIREE